MRKQEVSDVWSKNKEPHKLALLLIALKLFLSLFLAMKISGMDIFAMLHHLGCS
jgi:hypothetical protein